MENKISEEIYNNRISKFIDSENIILPEFSINYNSYWDARIDGLFSSKIQINDNRLLNMNDETILFLKEQIERLFCKILREEEMF